jgi:hypothetical protein
MSTGGRLFSFYFVYLLLKTIKRVFISQHGKRAHFTSPVCARLSQFSSLYDERRDGKTNKSIVTADWSFQTGMLCLNQILL